MEKEETAHNMAERFSWNTCALFVCGYCGQATRGIKQSISWLPLRSIGFVCMRWHFSLSFQNTSKMVGHDECSQCTERTITSTFYALLPAHCFFFKSTSNATFRNETNQCQAEKIDFTNFYSRILSATTEKIERKQIYPNSM